MFHLRVEVHNLDLKMPRRGDKWIMAEFICLGYSQKELIRLNRVRLHQQGLFISDVLCAKGKCLEEIYLSPRDRLNSWSTLDFLTEYPPGRDFALWNKALFQVAPRGRLQDRLEEFEQKGHKVWEWWYRPQDDLLFRVQI